MYVDAQVAVDPTAALQAVAVSPATGKTLYFYSEEHRELSTADKWNRVRHVMASVGELASQIDTAAAEGRPEALTLRLILQTGMRNGNPPQGALDDSKDSYGASSLLLEHIRLEAPDTLHLAFPGKKGVPQVFEVQDAVLYAYAQARAAAGEERLFPHQANATLRYLRKLDPEIKVHDLRAWYASALAQALIPSFEGVSGPKLPKAIAKIVAGKLGNTAGVAQKAYMHPGLFPEEEED
jgi:DNA topoisomerase IB